MSTASTIGPTDLELLRKIWARTSSPFAPEAANAREKAAALVARYGKTVADIPDLLAPKGEPAGNTRSNGFGFAGFDDWMEEQEPGHKARAAQERAEEKRRRTAYRAEVLGKYGSEKAAVAPTPMEQAVENAAAPFKRKELKTFANDVFETYTLDGWAGIGDSVPGHVRRTIEQALPLPTTIKEAKAEYDLWWERERELQAAYGYTGADRYLSLPCTLRWDIVSDLLQTGLRAQSLNDVLIRQRYHVDANYNMPEVEQAVLADLEHLTKMAETAPPQPVQNGQTRTTASDRRAEVIRLLSNMDAARLSDREIGRLVGVSPQTVGNIRRKHEASMSA